MAVSGLRLPTPGSKWRKNALLVTVERVVPDGVDDGFHVFYRTTMGVEWARALSSFWAEFRPEPTVGTPAPPAVGSLWHRKNFGSRVFRVIPQDFSASNPPVIWLHDEYLGQNCEVYADRFREEFVVSLSDFHDFYVPAEEKGLVDAAGTPFHGSKWVVRGSASVVHTVSGFGNGRVTMATDSGLWAASVALSDFHDFYRPRACDAHLLAGEKRAPRSPEEAKAAEPPPGPSERKEGGKSEECGMVRLREQDVLRLVQEVAEAKTLQVSLKRLKKALGPVLRDTNLGPSVDAVYPRLEKAECNALREAVQQVWPD